ncbi:hypothetical protein [Massilia sp. ST3]|uniref:hypothetical protein n=1 Tax=Massilia sp. ST3 TaxID=2824903 RepID=UPI001B81827F|nr:hypothetical protein [Massilia sp. ST3]MBQ5946083.1 hypothetical protein [Massilia sp. ST3]
MKLTLWAAIGALLAAPLAAHSQPTRHAPDPADPNAAVAPLVFESVIAVPPARDEAARTPDQRWRAANDAAGGLPGHTHDKGLPPPPDPAPAGHGKHHHAGGKQ